MGIPHKGTNLTERENDILKLLANGLSDSEIAEALVLTVGTVKWYNRQIYRKLDVPNRTQALVQAQRLGLLPNEGKAQATEVQRPLQMHLPAQVTAFIGRSAELTKLRQLLTTSRLLTLTGPPGTGKTRLALQFAAQAASLFADGVYFVSLAPVRDPALVLNSVAQAMDVTEAAKVSLLTAVKQFLGSKRILLILDNFEHVLPAAPLISELLSAAPELHVAVTSREVLRLYGEYEFSVPPLQLPDLRQPPALDVLKHYEAIELFVQQAQAVSSGFVLNAENAAAIAAICVHLDGLPLAIELAAARSKLYAPQTLLLRLSSRLQALTDGPRDLPARQKTLRDTLAWSYDLLDEDEKILFSRLEIFADGCTLDSAKAICGDNLKLDFAAGVESLLNKSLLRRESGSGDEPRFVMLETMREYALEKLYETSELADISSRHASHFQNVAEQAASELYGARQSYWLARLDAEHDNLRSALSWSLNADSSGQMSLRLIGWLAHFWELKGYFSEGRAWLAEAEKLPGAKARTKARADALQGVAEIAYLQCDYAATKDLFEEALPLHQESGDALAAAHTLIGLGEVASEMGDYTTALALFQQAYEIMLEVGDSIDCARALTQIGYAALRMGDYEQARSGLEQGLALYQAGDDQIGAALALAGLGEIALRQGELDMATKQLEASLAIRREISQKWGIGASLGSLGWVAVLQNKHDRAGKILRESFAIRREINDRGGMAWCMEKFAEMAQLKGDLPYAVQLYGAAAAVRESVTSVIDPADRPHYEAIIRRIRAGLGEEAFHAAWTEGQNLSVEQISDIIMR